jgi:hypothetical protein
MAREPVQDQQQAGMLNLQQVSRLLMISVEWVRKLHKAGYIPKTGKDQYPLVGTVQGYIRYMKDEDRRSSKSAADSRVRDARAKEIELRIAERERELISVEDAKGEFAQFVATVRSEMVGLPARVTRDMELRRVIEKEVDDSLSRMADRADKASAILEAGGEPSEAFAEDNA